MSNEVNETNGVEKKEISYIPALGTFDAEKSVVTFIGVGRGASIRYGVTFPIPSTDEEAKKRYNCTLNDLIKKGVRDISTAPGYQAVGFDGEGNLVPDGHAKMQALADGYKIGVRTAGAGKASLKQVNAQLAATRAVAKTCGEAAGMNEKEVEAMVAKIMAETVTSS